MAEPADRALASIVMELGLMRSAAAYRLDIPAERIRSREALAALFEALVLASGVSVCIEIGAFDAGFSRRLKQSRPALACVAFEANPHNWQKFAASVAADGVTYLNKGVGAAPGRLPFHIQESVAGKPVPPVRTNNSFLARSETGVEYRTEDVELTTIDAELAALAALPGPAAALWIDAEGFAGPVLSGASRSLADGRIGLALVELEDFAYWQGQQLAGDLIPGLIGHGLIPVARDFEYDHQYNVVFIHQSLLRDHHLRALLLGHFSREGAASVGSSGS